MSDVRKWALCGHGKQALPTVTRVPKWPPLDRGEAVEVVSVSDLLRALAEVENELFGLDASPGGFTALVLVRERLGLARGES